MLWCRKRFQEPFPGLIFAWRQQDHWGTLPLCSPYSGGQPTWPPAAHFYAQKDGKLVLPHPEPDDILLSKDVQHAAALAESFGLDLPLTKGAAATARAWLEGHEG